MSQPEELGGGTQEFKTRYIRSTRQAKESASAVVTHKQKFLREILIPWKY